MGEKIHDGLRVMNDILYLKMVHIKKKLKHMLTPQHSHRYTHIFVTVSTWVHPSHWNKHVKPIVFYCIYLQCGSSRLFSFLQMKEIFKIKNNVQDNSGFKLTISVYSWHLFNCDGSVIHEKRLKPIDLRNPYTDYHKVCDTGSDVTHISL